MKGLKHKHSIYSFIFSYRFYILVCLRLNVSFQCGHFISQRPSCFCVFMWHIYYIESETCWLLLSPQICLSSCAVPHRLLIQLNCDQLNRTNWYHSKYTWSIKVTAQRNKIQIQLLWSVFNVWTDISETLLTLNKDSLVCWSPGSVLMSPGSVVLGPVPADPPPSCLTAASICCHQHTPPPISWRPEHSRDVNMWR